MESLKNVKVKFSDEMKGFKVMFSKNLRCSIKNYGTVE